MGCCCRQVIGELQSVPSPFVRLVSTGYYDGPTDGLVECGACRTLYVFHKLDWDDGQDLRVFSLAPTRGSFAEFEGIVAKRAAWPTWIITGDGREGPALAHVQRFMDAAASVEFVVASRCLLKVVEIWRPSGLPQGVDWFEELGCDRVGDATE